MATRPGRPLIEELREVFETEGESAAAQFLSALGPLLEHDDFSALTFEEGRARRLRLEEEFPFPARSSLGALPESEFTRWLVQSTSS